MSHQQIWQGLLNHYSMSSAKEGVMDLSYLGFLKITGPEGKRFLQSQLTCHLDEVTAKQSRLGAHCNPRGRIISLFRIFYHQENYYLQMPRESVPIAMKGLKRYAAFFKVELVDASDELITIGYIGNQLGRFVSALPKRANGVVRTNGLIILNVPGETLRYQIIGSLTAISALFKRLVPAVKYISADHWKRQDIAKKFVEIYPETTEYFLPHDIHLHRNKGVSFKKGCYIGQEIIARMQYRIIPLKNRLHYRTLGSDATIQRGADLPNTTETIVDFCKKNGDEYTLLVLSAAES